VKAGRLMVMALRGSARVCVKEAMEYLEKFNISTH
jgi:hypothetical protein